MDDPEMAMLLAAFASRPIVPMPARLRGHVGFLQSTDPLSLTVLDSPSRTLCPRERKMGTKQPEHMRLVRFSLVCATVPYFRCSFVNLDPPRFWCPFILLPTAVPAAPCSTTTATSFLRGMVVGA